MILFGSSAMNCSPGLFSTAGYGMFGQRYQTVHRDTTEKLIDGWNLHLRWSLPVTQTTQYIRG